MDIDAINGRSNMEDRLVSVELRVDKVRKAPHPADLRSLLLEWGLTRGAQESLWVISYDGVRNLRTVTQVAVGTYHNVVVSIPAILSAVLLSGTDRFIVVHNHPNGVVTPTELDFELTRKIGEAAATVGLYFEDHVIVGPPDQWFTMLGAGVFSPSQSIADMIAAGAKPGQTAGAPLVFETFEHRGDS